jgi:hypothetical protein
VIYRDAAPLALELGIMLVVNWDAFWEVGGIWHDAGGKRLSAARTTKPQFARASGTRW